MRTNQSLLSRLIHYFFRGLLLFIPLGITLYLILFILRKIDAVASFGIPGLGMLIILISITILGYVGTTLFVKSAFGFTEGLIQKLPFIRVLYSYLKDLTSAFVGNKEKFDQPVMVLMDPTMQIYRIGFVTRTSLEVLSMPNHIAVYLPNSYDFAGMLFIVPPACVTPLDLPSTEVMKFTLSGGITSLKNNASTDDNDRGEAV